MREEILLTAAVAAAVAVAVLAVAAMHRVTLSPMIAWVCTCVI